MKIEQSTLIYRGDEEDGAYTVTVARQGQQKPLPIRRDLFNHSRDGFAWGYRGSGPAQLALAILADYFGATEIGDTLAVTLHQDFKEEVISLIKTEIWQLTGQEIGEAIMGLLVEDENRIHRVVAALSTRLYVEWVKEHETSEDTKDQEDATINPWIYEKAKEFLGDHIPLQPETIDKYLRSSVSVTLKNF